MRVVVDHRVRTIHEGVRRRILRTPTRKQLVVGSGEGDVLGASREVQHTLAGQVGGRDHHNAR